MRSRSTLFAVLAAMILGLLVLPPAVGPAQEPDNGDGDGDGDRPAFDADTLLGRWLGTATVPVENGDDVELPTELRLHRDDDGQLAAMVAQPKGNLPPLDAESVAVDGRTLVVTVQAGPAELVCRLTPDADGQLVGTMEVVGRPPALALRLARVPLPTEVAGHKVFTGTVGMGATKLQCALAFAQLPDGSWIGSMDVPAQQLKQYTLYDVEITDDTVRFVVQNNRVVAQVFEGTVDEDGTLTGALSLNGQKTAVIEATLGEGSGAITQKRPQTPKGPFPYHIEEVTFPGLERQGAFTLAGTLTVPEGDGPFPCAVLVNGSGLHDRDSTIMGHKPFLVIADHFARRGIAVLRYDERSVGESGTPDDPSLATSVDLADDAIAGVNFLKTRDRIDADRIGVIGHSEGGTIVAIVAATVPDDIAFMVSLAGPGRPGRDIVVEQIRLMLTAGGMDAEQIESLVRMKRNVFAAVFDDRLSGHALRMRVTAEMARHAERYPDTWDEEAGGLSAAVESECSGLNNPWVRYFLAHDPAEELRRIGCPVLALNGTKDLQVPWDLCLPAVFRAVVEGGNTDVTIRALTDLNHLFQHAGTGEVGEYEQIEETFAVEALDIMVEWIHEKTGNDGDDEDGDANGDTDD